MMKEKLPFYIAILCGGMLMKVSWNSLSTGIIHGRHGVFATIEDNPFLFWFSFGFEFLIAIIMLFYSAYKLLGGTRIVNKILRKKT